MLLGSIALVLLGWLAASSADHVSAKPKASARLGGPVSDLSGAVVVDWSVNCTGPAPGAANYGGNLSLIDADTGEEFYVGGTSLGSGSDTRIRASCFEDFSLHGSSTIEATGNVVTVSARGSGGGGGSGDRPGAPVGGQGGRDFPGSGFGGPTDPLRPGGCARTIEGTGGPDTLNGTSGPDLIFGLGGDDRIRGRGGHDCLIGGPGSDRLFGDGGDDRLTGGAGANTLVGCSGVNRYDAGAGNDVVNAVNGRRELVSCGPGMTARASTAVTACAAASG